MLRPSRLVLPMLLGAAALCLLMASAPNGPGTAAPVAPRASATPSPTATSCAPPPRVPARTPEPFYVDPVTSPTDLYTQTVTVYLGRGRQIDIVSEAGTVITTGVFSAYIPAHVPIALLPGITHHLTVYGRVEYATGCFYTLQTSHDRYGGLLVIDQIPAARVYLPANPGNTLAR